MKQPSKHRLLATPPRIHNLLIAIPHIFQLLKEGDLGYVPNMFFEVLDTFETP